ncbi:hypothetical protein L210DRAFT_3522302 [Boletus edulis BED1]|uniref:Uncharacterized protein n=1 Tax=Boletus edulis BED1 TaxID=1328754 RepID=A0AAD4C7C4_BOLED|nr:hypothetical protein L210DRAFT_3522302 [Boletus edulis BED1]
MHGTHKGRLTPTRYLRIPWYSCMSMACTRSADADDIPAKPTIPMAIVLLDTLVTLYFFSAGPLCFWTRSLLSISFLQGHCASGHARYSLFLFCRAIVLLDTLVTLYFFFAGPLCFWTRSAIVPLDTVVTITSWTTCDSNPDDRLGTGTSILGTS